MVANYSRYFLIPITMHASPTLTIPQWLQFHPRNGRRENVWVGWVAFLTVPRQATQTRIPISYRISTFWIHFNLRPPSRSTLKSFFSLQRCETLDNGGISSLTRFSSLFCWPFGGNIDFPCPEAHPQSHFNPFCSPPSRIFFLLFVIVEGKRKRWKLMLAMDILCWVYFLLRFRTIRSEHSSARVFSNFSRTWDATSALVMSIIAAERTAEEEWRRYETYERAEEKESRRGEKKQTIETFFLGSVISFHLEQEAVNGEEVLALTQLNSTPVGFISIHVFLFTFFLPSLQLFAFRPSYWNEIKSKWKKGRKNKWLIVKLFVEVFFLFFCTMESERLNKS